MSLKNNTNSFDEINNTVILYVFITSSHFILHVQQSMTVRFYWV